MRNIFVVGLDDFHLQQLLTLPNAPQYRFHALFTRAELRSPDGFPVPWLLSEGRKRLHRFPGTIDAIVSYWDFPASTILPLLRDCAGLPGPSLESVLRCEHKFWSRLEQRRAAPAHVPGFCAVDPFAEDPLSQVTLDFPFWIKPVKAVLSYLGFRIESRNDFERAIAGIRKGIGRFGKPFNHILEHAELPIDVAPVDGMHCIAESLISVDHQCTLEGYVYQGQVHVYGTIDSLREGPAGSSFSRYQHPSNLPLSVRERMADIAAQVMYRIGFDNGPFNLEMYWDRVRDHIWILEINPRISKSHAPLFDMVDGRYHHQVMVDLGLGQEPAMPVAEGNFACAAKFMVRHYEDAFVARVPTPEEIRHLEASMPGVFIHIDVTEGMQLSQLQHQDSYSYEVAAVFVGGHDNAELESRYAEVMAQLPLEFAPPTRPRTPAILEDGR